MMKIRILPILALSILIVSLTHIYLSGRKTTIFISESFYASLNSPSFSIYEIILHTFFQTDILLILPLGTVLFLFSTALLLIRHKNMTNKKIPLLIISTILCVIPAIIFGVIHFSKGVLFLIFISIMIYALISRNYILAFLSIIPIGLFGIHYVILTSIIIFYFSDKKQKALPHSTLFLLLLIMIINQIFFGMSSFANIQDFPQILGTFLFEFGNINGVSALFVILGIISLLKLFLDKHFSCFFIYVFLLGIGIGKEDVFFFSIILSILLMIIIRDFWEKKWNLDILRNITISVFVIVQAIIVFTFVVAYVSEIPSEDLFLEFETIRETQLSGKLLVFEHISQKTAFYTGKDVFPTTPLERKMYQQILFSSDFEHTKTLLKEQSIQYVFMNTLMITNSFNSEIKGLRILILDEDVFEPIIHEESFGVFKLIN